jgi:UDP-2-acetamido-3-amino-2,3-dideoxy-glucuronate N-acetyltransferase
MHGGLSVLLISLTIGEGAFIGAGAVVTPNVPAYALPGNPARRIGWMCACGERLSAELRCACGRRYARVEAKHGLRVV